jgi:hypothetical protein
MEGDERFERVRIENLEDQIRVLLAAVNDLQRRVSSLDGEAAALAQRRIRAPIYASNDRTRGT